MKIQQITQSQNFQAKPKFVSNNLLENSKQLLEKMRAEKTYRSNSDCWESTAVRALNIDNQASFKDGKYLAKLNKEGNLVPYSDKVVMFEHDKSRILFLNNGIIIDYKKPFFMRWKQLMETAETYVSQGLKFYNKPKCVEKVYFTSQGVKRAKDFVEKITDDIERRFK